MNNARPTVLIYCVNDQHELFQWAVIPFAMGVLWLCGKLQLTFKTTVIIILDGSYYLGSSICVYPFRGNKRFPTLIFNLVRTMRLQFLLQMVIASNIKSRS